MTKAPELFLISVAAELLEMHPQTLRKYERLGLVRPLRTLGSMRVYTRAELDRIRLIKRLVDDGGINLAGVQRLLSIADLVGELRPALEAHARTGRRSDALRQMADQMKEICRLVGLTDRDG